ncbi:MAG: undecaprenyl/decaprenyl-phosphate alpha-N-acetylglucosaminyl 1-phosphate transferase [Chloroflexi bacterium]|nr:undecaprenyl/decaprenyl-phosphate alpha-N-acetylglucosaminyl 1-phosphate transferase [Chloroflexota bacterium]
MSSVILIFIIALAVTLVSTPFVRRLAIAIGFVDAPAQRKLHSTPMPLMGGVAIFGSSILALVLAVLRVRPFQSPEVQGIFLACAVVALTGLIDDRVHLPPWAKFSGQIAGFAILVLFDVYVKLPIPLWLNYVITFVWVTGITNAINFLDNMDGLSAGVSGICAAFVMLLGALNGQILVSGLAAAVLGACLGFLRYNFKPAQIFMGDVGALFLGFLLAILGIQLRFPDNSNAVTWMVPVLIMGLPIFDTSLVVFSRLRRGISPLTAGKDHTSHRLVDRGFSQREAVLTLYLMTGVFGMTAIFVTQANLGEGYFVGGAVAAAAAYVLWRLDRNYKA